MSLSNPLFTREGGPPVIGETYEVYLGKARHEWVIRLLRDEEDAAAYFEEAKCKSIAVDVWLASVTITGPVAYVPPVPATVSAPAIGAEAAAARARALEEQSTDEDR